MRPIAERRWSPFGRVVFGLRENEVGHMAPLWRADSNRGGTGAVPSSSSSSSGAGTTSPSAGTADNNIGGSCTDPSSTTTIAATTATGTATASTNIGSSATDAGCKAQGEGGSTMRDEGSVDLEARPDRSPTAQLRHANWGALMWDLFFFFFGARLAC